jgi:RNA polymerase sigma-70 factor (ECF subfamily)
VLPLFDKNGRHAGAIVDWSASIDEVARDTELRRVLTGTIGELPPDYRSALVLRDIEGFPSAEVAQALGVDVVTLRSRLHRARLFLRKRLAMYFSTRSRRDGPRD